MKTHTLTVAAMTAVLLGAGSAAMAQAPQTQPGGGAAFNRAETPGRPAVPAGQDYSQPMERLFQAAQRLREAVQTTAQQPAGERRNQAMAQAREALMHTQQAMVQLPPDLRTGQTYRDAEQRMNEARQAVESPQADPQRAQAAVDAYLVLIPRLQTDAAARSTTAAAAPATGSATAGVPLHGVTNLPGTDLIGPNGQKVGEIENLLVDREGNVRAVVVEWGGFLGLGDREALVPMNRIQLGATNADRARISMTREQLEALPRWNRDRLADYGREYGWGDGLRWYR